MRNGFLLAVAAVALCGAGPSNDPAFKDSTFKDFTFSNSATMPTMKAPMECVLEISGTTPEHGQTSICVKPTGEVKITGAGISAASRLFWEKVAVLYPQTCPGGLDGKH